MSGRRNRERKRVWQMERERQAALVTPRHYREEIVIPGIEDTLVMRISVLASFEPVENWEVCREQTSGALRLYVARGTDSSEELVVGYARVEIEPTALEERVERVLSAPAPAGGLVDADFPVCLDGVGLEVSFYRRPASLRLDWQEGCAPGAWSELERSVLDAVDVFRRAPNSPV